MKKQFLFIAGLILLLGFSSLCQVVKPVKWTFSSRRISNVEAELFFKASIQEKWHIYSPFTPDGGPLPMIFNYDKSKDFIVNGKIIELQKPEVEYDDVFNVNTLLFKKQVTFKQKLRLATSSAVNVKGNIEYQACIEGKCIPDGVDFNIQVNKFSESVKAELNPQSEAPVIKQGDTSVLKSPTTPDYVKNAVPSTAVTDPDNDKTQEPHSMWGFFWIAFLSGFLGILTPCVFPMIPMTVSFFLGTGDNRRKAFSQAMVFGISIVFIYTMLGLIVSLLHAGADFGTVLSTHWIPNIIFFILFLIFALSFFGLFEIVLPGNIGSKTDSMVDKGGVIGAFFMALTLVIVSFACTGPIIGFILVEAARGVSIQPIIGMLGYSIAFALPFTIFALFPSALKKIPKSGSWLNVIKVVMAFILLALSFKFLSNIDQTYNLNFISRDVYISIWIAIFAITGLYLLGKIMLPHDSRTEKIGVFRMLFSLASFTFAIYLFTGLLGNPLSSLSMFLPPPAEKVSVSIINREVDYPGLCGKAKYSDFLHFSNGIRGYFEYDEGLACAKQQNKPVLLYFKGHACTNCKVMDAKVWSDPVVQDILRNKYVIIGLYVDDRTELPQSSWVTSKYDGKLKKTIGKVNLDYQITRFNTNTQPYYATLDSNGELKGVPVGFDTDIAKFKSFLENGISEFHKSVP